MARSLHTAAHRELVSAVIDLRKTAGLTQRALALRLGREQNFVARIETGQRRVDLVEWVMICRGCEIDPVDALPTVVARLSPLVKVKTSTAATRRPK